MDRRQFVDRSALVAGALFLDGKSVLMSVRMDIFRRCER
jgi:hypothetical protein